MVLFLHNRYRIAGGEERAVEDLIWLVREHLGLEAELLERRSADLPPRRAAAALLRGGVDEREVAEAVRQGGARLIHAHNLLPAFGWRALAAARAAGARVVLHLHQYRLVCAVGTCFTHDGDCTRCHGRNTLPGIRHNCRGSIGESVTYAAALAAWQRRLLGLADAVVVPSRAALERLQVLGVPLPATSVLPHPLRDLAAAPEPGGRRSADGPALLVSRLAPEKGVAVAIEACRRAGLRLVVAGDGPEYGHWRQAAPPGVTFLGRVERERLRELRATAALELAPSLFAESFGLSAAEALAAGLPVAGSAVGALPDLLPPAWLAPPGDPDALAAAIGRVLEDPSAPATAHAAVAQRLAPQVVAAGLAKLYAELGVSG